ncbi:MAG: Fatty acid desaturase family protein [Labilithrix sp.]|nr:Fatty acid desaturase family protein [Labilithrix sp.]
MPFFRHREDRLPVAIIAAMFACDVLVFATVDSVPFLVVWALLGIGPKGAVSAFNHHHQHLSVFRVPVLNRALEIMYGLQTGITSHGWVLHHSLGHHVNYLEQKTDESRWRREDGVPMGELEYSLNVAATAYPRMVKVAQRTRKYQRMFVGMAVVTLTVLAALVAWRPLPALVVFVGPMVTMLFWTAWATFTHHSGKKTSNHFVASNNILHRGYNVITGNLGYHTAHHYRPGVHWSKLPALHDSIAQQIPADCYLSPGLPWNFGQEVVGPPDGMPFAPGSSTAADCEPVVKTARSFARTSLV